MRHVDLFSGIGGFALAARWVWSDHEVVTFCESDRFCREVLRKHWPGVPIATDITTYRGDELRGTVDLITGGFPCQPYSHAGQQQGASDDRALWPEMYRVCREVRPRWIVAENVVGIIRLGLDSVLADLEDAGYSVATIIVPAIAVDAPHRRDRVWIIAADTPDAEVDDQRSGLRTVEPTAFRRRRSGHGGCSRATSDTDGERCEERDSAPVATSPRLTTGAAAEKRTPARWAAEPGMDRVADGVPRRVDRLRALGNAIVPQVAAQIFEGIKHVDGRNGE